MNNTILILFFYLLLNYGVSPKLKAQESIRFSMNGFLELKEIKGEKVKLKDPIKNPYEIILIDSLLLVKNYHTDPAVDIYNLNTGKIISSFCKVGRGSGELTGPFCIQYVRDEKEIMIQDVVGRKIVFFDLELILMNAPIKHTKTIKIDERVLVRKVMQVKDGNFFCDQIGDKTGYMNCLLDSTGKLIRYLEKYPETDFKFDFNLGSNIFPTNIGISVANIIVSYMNSDMIDVYDANGKLLYIFRGPDYKDPDVSEGSNSVGLTYKNKEAYNIPCSNEKYFMIPYRGEEYKYEFTPADHILCFGFNGQLLQHFTVSPSVTEIAVDWDKRIIYSINLDKEPTLYKYAF